MHHLQTRLQFYSQALSAFTSSSSSFRVLASLPTTASSSTPNPKAIPPPKSLYILDSSFNPPTLAHLRIALSALKNDKHESIKSPKRLILLLSTQNADKAAKPAAFEQRLVMMEILAHDLLSALHSSPRSSASQHSEPRKEKEEVIRDEQISIDIALTTHALFTQKALAISSSPSYQPQTPQEIPQTQIPQTHLVGYDTLIRILSPKYYSPPSLASLSPFLSANRLLVTYRAGASWQGKREQDAYLAALRNGERDQEGGKREWVSNGRIVFDQMSARGEGEEVVSSTKVREAVKAGDGETLRKLVTEGVREWVLSEGLYIED